MHNDKRIWHSRALTHQGNVRDHNEDAFLDLPGERLWVVADGMGGHASGEVASRAIVDVLAGFRATGYPGLDMRNVRQALRGVNRDLVEQADPASGRIIGSTVAALHIEGDRAVCLWAGDSRIYRLRSGVLQRITRDHNEMQELIDSGMAAEDAALAPYAEAITRAVGGDANLETEAQIVEIQDRDLFLICSDGLNKELTDTEIQHLLSTFHPLESVSELLNAALRRRGQDNITVLVAYHATTHRDG